ncbi:glycoside hydrolase family 127 protein [Geofilum sp. OHC36d9]|uniref:glycoside hydrolase family 127 protein n=1 Tax=Geofilum sp. OHC36d9 TaxID=3458413 RepID=UPI00403396C2
MKKISLIMATAILGACQVKEQPQIATDYPISPIPFNEVHLNDQFWLPKIETNQTVTIPVSFAKCEEMGRMDNFLIAGGVLKGTTKGAMPFDDSDVYKIIEGASYSLTTHYDKELDAYLDSIIAIIAIGQEEDGYLTTWKTIDPTQSPASWCPPGQRWEGLASSHELYNSGHLFEAAAAHYRATGKSNFLNIATKNADLLVSVFGDSPDKNPEVPGHQIVETGLIKLYLITQNKSYLNLAKHFLDQRGDSTKRQLWGAYNQDHQPVVEQKEAVGHAVRAVYMYAGMTDVAALFNDSAYRRAVDSLWKNVVDKKIYITGGIVARHNGEAFGDNYELPNLTAYNETCAAIANVYWNYRMFLLHGEAKYIDVLERSLYNGVISGVGMDGKTFFYPNPLECDLQYQFNQGALTRQPWFDCSCCPTNLCRFMPSVPGYIYAHNNDQLFVNLFVASNTVIKIKNRTVAVSQHTNYPWEGNITLAVNPDKPALFTLKLRIPGWAEEQPVPSDLYTFSSPASTHINIKINGNEADFSRADGYAVLTRKWKQGDVVTYTLPMEIRNVLANSKVKDDKGKTAIERGPIVYCFEGVDNPAIDQLIYSPGMKLTNRFEALLLDGIETLQLSDGTITYTAIPYYSWNNRGVTKMKTWIPQK